MPGLCTLILVFGPSLVVVLGCADAKTFAATETDSVEIAWTEPLPPLQDFGFSPNEIGTGENDLEPFRFFDHGGAEYGRLGSDEGLITWGRSQLGRRLAPGRSPRSADHTWRSSTPAHVIASVQHPLWC